MSISTDAIDSWTLLNARRLQPKSCSPKTATLTHDCCRSDKKVDFLPARVLDFFSCGTTIRKDHQQNWLLSSRFRGSVERTTENGFRL